jgi:tetratricopeptide (TPR) repeat protein
MLMAAEARTAAMAKRLIWLVALAALSLVLAPAWAGCASDARVDAAFREACDLYERGDFGGALAGFETIRAEGIKNAAVYFNLGNCYYRQDQLGRSIVSYRRALLLAPRDGDARTNLGLARASVYGGDSTAARSPGFPALPLRIASPRQVQALFYAAYYLAAAFFLAVLFLGGKLRRGVFYGLVVALVVAGVAFGLSRYGASKFTSESEAVVVVDRAELKSGPGNAFEEVSVLPDGSEVTLRARSGMWVEVTLSTGEVGWLREDDIDTI